MGNRSLHWIGCCGAGQMPRVGVANGAALYKRQALKHKEAQTSLRSLGFSHFSLIHFLNLLHSLRCIDRAPPEVVVPVRIDRGSILHTL